MILYRQHEKQILIGYVPKGTSMFGRKKYLFARKTRIQYIRDIVIGAIILFLAFSVFLFIYFNFFGTASRVKLKDSLNAEINSKAMASDYIENIDGGKLKKDVQIDTSKLGKKKCKLVLIIEGEEKNYDFEVKVVDTKAPTINMEGEVNVLLGNTSKIEDMAKVSDNSGKFKTQIKGNYDAKKAGSYKLRLIATDNSGNKAEKEIKINVIDMDQTEGDMSFVTGKGFKLTRVDGLTSIDGILIVNNSFSLPESYGIGAIQKDTYAEFNNLLTDARTDGVHFSLLSGYRSYRTQKEIYDDYVSKHGKEAADKAVSRPGYSEHQTGYALDLNNAEESFGNTNEGKWLAANCAKYGFIIRYPKGKESVTGRQYQPWHIRYVGPELAKKLYNNGEWITLEEYFGISSVYSK